MVHGRWPAPDPRTRSWAADGTFAADAEGWTCTECDLRGRAVKVAQPAYGTAPGRTITTNYAVGGNPLVTATTDSAGTITTSTDVLGRVV